MTEAAYAVQLRWRPVATPLRSPWAPRALMALLALALLARCALGQAARRDGGGRA
jgi:hypothetical protein